MPPLPWQFVAAALIFREPAPRGTPIFPSANSFHTHHPVPHETSSFGLPANSPSCCDWLPQFYACSCMAAGPSFRQFCIALPAAGVIPGLHFRPHLTPPTTQSRRVPCLFWPLPELPLKACGCFRGSLAQRLQQDCLLLPFERTNCPFSTCQLDDAPSEPDSSLPNENRTALHEYYATPLCSLYAAPCFASYFWNCCTCFYAGASHR